MPTKHFKKKRNYINALKQLYYDGKIPLPLLVKLIEDELQNHN